jgi:hypothetical protein
MRISQLLLESAIRFNRAAESVRSSGICPFSDREEFNRLVKIKIAATDHESATAAHTISEGNHVYQKFSAREAS